MPGLAATLRFSPLLANVGSWYEVKYSRKQHKEQAKNRISAKASMPSITSLLICSNRVNSRSYPFAGIGEVSTPLLKSKHHIPPVQAELVSRSRLVEGLKEGLHRKLLQNPFVYSFEIR